MLSSHHQITGSNLRDENAIVHHQQQSLNKTPGTVKHVTMKTPFATSKLNNNNNNKSANTKRRVFGDISNRKGTKPTATAGSKPVAIAPIQPQVTKKPSAVKPKKRIVDFQLPVDEKSKNNKNDQKIESKTAAAVIPKSNLITKKAESVPDIELPAGRLFRQQHNIVNDLHDIDFDNISLDGATTICEDWINTLDEQYNNKIQYEKEQKQLAMKLLVTNTEKYLKNDDIVANTLLDDSLSVDLNAFNIFDDNTSFDNDDFSLGVPLEIGFD